MSVSALRGMTLEAFLAWEERQPLRYEFDGSGPVAMTGGTVKHATIQGNLASALIPRLRGGPCRFYGSDLKFQTGSGKVRYPDGMVVCGPLNPNAEIFHNPTVVFEALSPSTARTDRIHKAREYQATPSVMRYVMLEAGGIGAVVFARQGEIWTHELLDADAELRLPEIDVALPLAELYEGAGFDAE